MKRLPPFFAIVLLCFALPATALGQGVLRGTVRDAQTDQTLPGANLFLVGTGLGAATDIEGDYRISDIPAGTYTLRISFIGYEPDVLEVIIRDGFVTEQNIQLGLALLEGDEIVVTGQAEGQVAAINQQLTANTIVNVISEEKIQELPDANAAEAIGRLPGVALQRSGGEANRIVLRGLSDRFSSVTIDGVRIPATDAEVRGVDLSTISQGSLAGIELFKALTPDKDADAIAGSVNLVTKKAPAERLLRVEARGSYNDLNSNWGQYDLVARYGERFLSNRLGVQVSGNLEQRDRSNEYYDLSYNLGLNDGTDYEITELELNFTEETRTRQGASLLLDLDTPDGGTIRLNNIYNQTARDFIEYNRNYPTDGSELFYGARDREQDISTFNTSLRGENYLFGLTATWGASYAYSASDYPFDYDMDFFEPSATDAEGNPIAGMDRIPSDLQKGPPENISNYALNNFQRAYFYTGFYREEENDESEITTYLDLAKDYTLGTAVAGRLKIGGKYRQKSRMRTRSELLSPYYNEAFPRFVRGEDGVIREKSFVGTPFENLDTVGDRILVTNLLNDTPEGRDLFDDFTLFPLLDRDALRMWWELNQHGFSDQNGRNPEYERNLEANGFFYDITERVMAGYAMNTFNVGQRLTLLAGVRMEHEDGDYDAKYSPNDLSGFPVPTGAIRDTSATNTETVWLPNAHLTFRPTRFLNIRLAAYKALARPSFNQRLPTFVARKAGTFYPGNSLFVGNPDLRVAQAWNYEINTSVFHNKLGLVSVSAFYKDIEDMYHLIDGAFFDAASADSLFGDLGIIAENPFETQGFALTYPYNSSRPTRVWGLEVEHQANLLFLPGLLRNLVLSYNLSLIRSETYIPGTRSEEILIERPPLPPIPSLRYHFVEREQKLEGQPELLANIALGYDIKGFSARISMFHQGEYNTRFSPNGRDDRAVKSYTRWDLALKQEVFGNVAVVVNLNNITGVDEGTTVLNRLQGWRLPNDRETYGLTADFGVRVTL